MNRPYHTGATLAVTLIILFVITLLGVSAIKITQMQEKMSSNLQDKELSFAAAETALTEGEQWVLNLASQPNADASCSSFPCTRVVYQNFILEDQDSSWWNANSAAYPNNLQNIKTPPRYIVEFLQFVPDTLEIGNASNKNFGVHYYQITARGTGSTDDSVSVLQTTVGRRF